MPLKRKANGGALLRKANGALMSDCCCETICSLDACLADAEATTDDPRYAYGCTQSWGGLMTSPIFTRMGTLVSPGTTTWNPQWEEWIQQQKTIWGQVAGNEYWLSWWWFNSKQMLKAGDYKLTYLSGLSWVDLKLGSGTYIRGYNLAYSATSPEASKATWRYVAIVQPCVIGEKPTIYEIHPNVAPFTNYADAELYYQNNTPELNITLDQPSYVGIALFYDRNAQSISYNYPEITVWNTNFSVQSGQIYKVTHPIYQLDPCDTCSPVAPTGETLVTDIDDSDFGKVMWTDHSPCYNKHLIYMKAIANCDDCAESDPSIEPDFTFEHQDVSSCADGADIANELLLTGIDAGRYCIRVDAVREHLAFDTASLSPASQTFTTTTKTAKGTPFCADVTCPPDAVIDITSPDDGGTFQAPSVKVKFKYRYCTNLQISVGGMVVWRQENTYSTTEQELEIDTPVDTILCSANPNDVLKNDIVVAGSNLCSSASDDVSIYACQVKRDPPPASPSCGTCSAVGTYTITVSNLTGESSILNGVYSVPFKNSTDTLCVWQTPLGTYPTATLVKNFILPASRAYLYIWTRSSSGADVIATFTRVPMGGDPECPITGQYNGDGSQTGRAYVT